MAHFYKADITKSPNPRTQTSNLKSLKRKIFHLSMELQISATNLLTLVLILVIVPKVLEISRILVWRPLMLTRRFKKQGVSGPKYKLLHGNLQEIKKMKTKAKLSVLDLNSNDVFPRVYPHFHQWMSQYGDTFLYWHGTEAKLCISDPDLAKQILSNKSSFSAVPKTRPQIFKLFGKGLPFTEGLDWIRHRKILNPAFSIDRVKVMTKVMGNCTLKMLEEWGKHGETEKLGVVEMEMHKEFQRLTTEIISVIVFGNNSKEGIEIFRSQTELLKRFVVSVTTVFVPGAQYLPTPSNLQIWKLDKKVKNSIKRIIDERLKSESKNLDSVYGDDLLGVMMRSGDNKGKLSIDEIIDECKTLFFSGHGTTSLLMTWTMMLLSLHQNWQEKLREEIFRECGKDKIPDADTLPKLKLMHMVLMESLRLYGPVIKLFREATQDTKIGHVEIPKGTAIFLIVLKIHSDKAIWGDDGDKFNPMRFENGVSVAANHPNAFLAFSTGPRTCIGQNFVMSEAKIVLAMILQRFRFSLSGEYVHAPVDHLDLHPQYGVPLIIQPLQS